MWPAIPSLKKLYSEKPFFRVLLLITSDRCHHIVTWYRRFSYFIFL